MGPGALPLATPRGLVEARDLWFHYPPKEPIIPSLYVLSDSTRSCADDLETTLPKPNRASRHCDDVAAERTVRPLPEIRRSRPRLKVLSRLDAKHGQHHWLPPNGSMLRAATPGVRDKEPWVLCGLSFVMKPGTMTAIVGPTAAGKTTVAFLLARLYDPTQGSFTIDGQDVRDVTLSSLASAIGIVSQDAQLFHATVRANLMYARPDASEGDMKAACTLAQLEDVIASLPNGYETIIGEKGYRLSGGERQRLAIARVILKDPVIVVLDEATAHLDSETEARVERALAVVLRQRTSLVMAHRLSTVQRADQILVMDRGRIVQRGTHQTLMATPGLYRQLYRRQFRVQEATKPTK